MAALNLSNCAVHRAAKHFKVPVDAAYLLADRVLAGREAAGHIGVPRAQWPAGHPHHRWAVARAFSRAGDKATNEFVSALSDHYAALAKAAKQRAKEGELFRG